MTHPGEALLPCKCGLTPYVDYCVFWGATNRCVKCKCGAKGEPHAWEEGAIRNWNQGLRSTPAPASQRDDLPKEIKNIGGDLTIKNVVSYINETPASVPGDLTATEVLMLDKAREGYEAEKARIEAPLKQRIKELESNVNASVQHANAGWRSFADTEAQLTTAREENRKLREALDTLEQRFSARVNEYNRLKNVGHTHKAWKRAWLDVVQIQQALYGEGGAYEA